MPRNKLEVTVVPRVELDQRAREARLRLERAERLFAPQPAVTYSWPRWLICSPNVSIFGDAPRKSRTRKPLSDQRPSRVYSAPMFCTKKVAVFGRLGFVLPYVGCGWDFSPCLSVRQSRRSAAIGY